MATDPLSKAVRNLRLTLSQNEDTALPDTQLLSDFIERHDDASFAVLVRRHSPLVMGVCRRVARDRQDAEDAFQASFLVLVRRAASIARRELLANWLYRVAYKTAVKIRTATYKRRTRERQVTDMPERAMSQPSQWSDLMPFLDQELSRLPEKYRLPVILCDLEGKTQKKAAQLLGCPENTLTTRLVRARAMLAKRLTRHGVSLLSGALAAALAQRTASAKVPPGLVGATVKAASAVALGVGAASGLISVKVMALAEGVLKGMVVEKAKVVLAVVMGLGLAAGGAGWARFGGINPSKPEASAPVIEALAHASGSDDNLVKPRVDQYGDKLPEGALSRFGTSRLRHGQYVVSVAFSPDGKEVASSSYDGTIRFWDVKTGMELRRFPKTLETPDSIAYTANGKELIIAEETWWGSFAKREFRGVRVWDSATGKPFRELGVIRSPMDARRIAVSAHGSLVAYPNGRSIAVIDPANPVRPILPNDVASIEVEGAREITHVALSTDGRRLAVGALLNAGGQIERERQPSFVRVYDLQTGKEIWTKEGFTGNAWGHFPAAEFSPDGKTMALSFTYTMQMELADAATGKWMRRFSSRTVGFWPLKFTSDGSKLYVTGWRGPNEIWNVNAGETTGAWSRREGVFALALSPDGKTVASAEGRSVRLVVADTGEPAIPEIGVSGQVDHIQLHPNGQWLLGASHRSGNGFTIWDRVTGRRLFDHPTETPQ